MGLNNMLSNVNAMTSARHHEEKQKKGFTESHDHKQSFGRWDSEPQRPFPVKKCRTTSGVRLQPAHGK